MQLRFLTVLALAASVSAQSFYVPSDTPGTGTANSFPFNTSDMRYQALILATELGSTPAMITGFALAPSSTGVRTFTSVTMKMAHLAAPTLSTTFDANLAAGAVTTMDVANWSWPLTGNVWNDVDLQVPFAYNGTDNLVVEFLVTGSAGSNAAMRRDGTNQRVYLGSYTGQLTGTNGGLTAFKMRVIIGDARTAVFGTGCPGSNSLTPALSFTGTSQLGQTLTTNVANLLPNAPAFLVLGFHAGPPYPLDLGGFGFPGCVSYFPPVSTQVTVADGGGSASIATTIPNNPAFVGLFFYAQWAAVDNNTVVVSNYGRVLVGN